MPIAVHNSSGQPLVVTNEGRVLGDGEFAAIDSDERTQALLDDGSLTRLRGAPNDDMDPSAVEALTAAQPAKKKTTANEES